MKLQHITKKYGQNTVLDDIDFDFGESQIVGLIGKNGVGKTTLMKVMNNNIINYQGKVDMPKSENVGYLIEHPKLYGNKTGLFNLKLFAQVLGDGFDKEYANHIIEAFGMKPYIKKKVNKYSMGMKILISSHKLEDIELICDRAVFLRDGKFVQDVDMKDGGPEDSTILTLQKDDFNKALDSLSENFKVQQSQKESGEIIIKAQNDYRELLKSLSQLDIYPKYIETRKSSLRDTYFNINQRGDK